jgi:hypothetical protein
MQLPVAVAGAKGYPSQIRFWLVVVSVPQQSPVDVPALVSQHCSPLFLQAANVDTVTVVGPAVVVAAAVVFVQTLLMHSNPVAQ